MKSSILRAGVVALACALGLSACGGGSGDLYLTGAVYNVTKDGLVLTNNGEDLAVTTPYTSFQVNNGKARANYYTIAVKSVTCTIRKRALTASINNLTGSGLVLINGADKQTVAAGTNTVKMSPVNEDGAYGVTVLTQPTGQTCTVSGGSSGNGSGIMGATEGTTVTVTCA